MIRMIILAALWILLSPVQAQADEYIIYDKDYQTKYHVKDGAIYDRNWNRQGSIREVPRDRVHQKTYRRPDSGDRRILGKDFRTKGHIRRK